jgi:hypothetical protein
VFSDVCDRKKFRSELSIVYVPEPRKTPPTAGFLTICYSAFLRTLPMPGLMITALLPTLARLLCLLTGLLIRLLITLLPTLARLLGLLARMALTLLGACTAFFIFGWSLWTFLGFKVQLISATTRGLPASPLT